MAAGHLGHRYYRWMGWASHTIQYPIWSENHINPLSYWWPCQASPSATNWYIWHTALKNSLTSNDSGQLTFPLECGPSLLTLECGFGQKLMKDFMNRLDNCGSMATTIPHSILWPTSLCVQHCPYMEVMQLSSGNNRKARHTCHFSRSSQSSEIREILHWWLL